MKFETVTLKGHYRGRDVSVSMQGFSCPECGYATVRGRDMAEFERLVKAEYSRQEQMVTAEELQSARAAMGVSQEEFAQFLQIGTATVKRIESGSVPQDLANEHIKMWLHPERLDVFIQDRIWELNELTGELSHLWRMSDAWTQVWRGVIDCFSVHNVDVANFDALFQGFGTQCYAVGTLQELTANVVQARPPAKQSASLAELEQLVA